MFQDCKLFNLKYLREAKAASSTVQVNGNKMHFMNWNWNRKNNISQLFTFPFRHCIQSCDLPYHHAQRVDVNIFFLNSQRWLLRGRTVLLGRRNEFDEENK